MAIVGRPPEQRQDSLYDQVKDLLKMATAAGMYDAADWLQDRWNERTNGRRI